MKFGVLRERAFALLFSAQLISASGDVIASVAVPFAILQLGGSARDIGLMLAAGAIVANVALVLGTPSVRALDDSAPGLEAV